MNSIRLLSGLLLLALLLSVGVTTSVAQFRDYNFKYGLQFNGLVPATEFSASDGLKGSYLARAFARFAIADQFKLDIGAGYGSFAGLDFDRAYYRTEIIPVDARLLFNFWSNETWSPYIYAGVGAMNYRVTSFPASVSPKPVDADNGLTEFIPAGIGTEFSLADNIALDLNVGVSYTGTDNLNYYIKGDPKDAYYTGGLAFVFGPGAGSLDADNDGLKNKEEKELGTDPHNPDTDGDGLSDGDEVLKYHTDPLKKDSDGDGLTDGEEVLKYHTDPNKMDSDGDGLSDGDEVLKYHTDPLKVDTDGDGLSDGDEILKYHTDPLKIDTDGDKLTDGDEVLKYHTDPNKQDTDGGSVDDGVEVARGTDPLNPNDDIKKEEIVVEKGKSIVLEGVIFETNKSEILPESEQVLEKAYNTLNQNPDVTVEIRGYTDNTGKKAKNMKLSENRANAVKDYLVKKGIAPDRITTKGYGPSNPVADNTTKEGKQKNRRIEFFRVK